MTSLLEKLVAKIAPHYCLVCSKEDNVVCEACSYDLFSTEESACVLCQAPTVDFAICKSCKPTTNLQHVWFTANYEGVVAKVIKLLKFERAAAAAEPLARAMTQMLPALPPDTIVVPVPTAASRIRKRGYDQTNLLAAAIGKEKDLSVRHLLLRKLQYRQVGASRRVRAAQSVQAFDAAADCSDKTILLVDDVVTTGATLCAAAKALQQGGAKTVVAVVAARTL